MNQKRRCTKSSQNGCICVAIPSVEVFRCSGIGAEVRSPIRIFPLASSPVGPFVDTKEPSRLDLLVRKEAIAEEDA